MSKKIIWGIVVTVVIIALGGYVYIYFSQRPYVYDRGHNLGLDISDWKTYKNEDYGFEFKYPNEWKIGEGSQYNHPENSISFLSVSGNPPVIVSVSTEKAQNVIAKIQKIIDAHYVTPDGTYGMDTNYAAESWRYEVDNFTTPSGVKVYSYRYIGKYSIISRNFFFDTNNATIVFSVTYDGNSDNSTDPMLLINSIKITKSD